MNRLRIPHYYQIRAHRATVNSTFSNRHQKPVCYSTGLAPKREYGPADVGRCTMRNGIKVVAAKTDGAPVVACTILYQGGSRYEQDDQLGATHFLRTCSSAAGCAYTTFSKTRVLQQLGAYITVNSDRQSVAYTLRCPMPAFHDVKYYLLDIASRTGFKQNEVDDRKAQVKLDLKTAHPEARVLDLVQKACWGGPLNNSVFCAKTRINSMTAKDMEDFHALNMRAAYCSVGSYGLPFEDIMRFAEMIEQKREGSDRPRCDAGSFARGGFEYHDLGPDSDTWIAVAVPGCGNTNLSCLMMHSILAAACGTGAMSRGQHHVDRVSHAPLVSCAPDVHTSVRAFNVSYSDTGVFGLPPIVGRTITLLEEGFLMNPENVGPYLTLKRIVAKTRSCAAAATARAIAKFLKNIGSLTPEQIHIGKQRLKLDIALTEDDCVSVSEGLALQAACDVKLHHAGALAALDQVPEGEVARVAQHLASRCNKMAVAVVGDVQAVPHDMELRHL